MKHLKKKQVEELRNLLLQERERVLSHLQKLTASQEILEANANMGDTADVAHIEISQNNISKIGLREAKLLKKIDEALARFDSKEYGICQNCGEPIPFERLRVRPVATLCIECKNEEELRERRYGGKIEDEGEDSFESEEKGETPFEEVDEEEI
jgi:DnaK suppressor protein